MKLALEHKASLGIILMLSVFIGGVVYVGHRNLWFEPKQTYITRISSADGLYEGSLVTLSGLRVGEVEKLHVDQDNRIEVTFSVRTSMAHKIRRDSLAQIIRSFIIGEKRIEIKPGSTDQPQIQDGGLVTGQDSKEITDLLSGQEVSALLTRVDRFISSIEALISLFSALNPEDVRQISKILYPTLYSLNQVTTSLYGDLLQPGLAERSVQNFDAIASPVAKRQEMISSLLNNLDTISRQIEADKSFAKNLTSAISELTLTLQALQKTWLLEDYVDELKLKEKIKRKHKSKKFKKSKTQKTPAAVSH